MLWHVAGLTSLAALIASLRRRVPAVTVLAMAAVVAEIGLMRKAGQAGDVATLWIPLFAWLVREAPWYGKTVLGGIAVVSLAAVLTVTRASERLPQIAQDSRRPPSAGDERTATPLGDAADRGVRAGR